MRCFKTPTQFAVDYRRRNGEPAPEQRNTKYVVEYDSGYTTESSHAPRSYGDVKKAVFVVDGVGMAERIFGVWTEGATPIGRRWLYERALRRDLDRFRRKGFHINGTIRFSGTGVEAIQDYLSGVTQRLTREIVPRIIEKTSRCIEAAGEFELLERYGESLDNPPS